jgi:hypothetical protein
MVPPGQHSQHQSLLLELQLINRAILCRDVIAWPEVDGLVDGSTLPVGVEVADFDYGADRWDVLVWGDADVACGL